MTSSSTATFRTFLQDAVAPSGAKNIELEQLESYIDMLRDDGYWLPRVEVSELKGEREIPNLSLSIIGADKRENWEHHQNHERHWALVRKKLSNAHTSELSLVFRVWAEKVDQEDRD